MRVIWVDQCTDDLYGFNLHDAKPDERLSVTLVVHLGFSTTERLTEVEQRLVQARYVPTMTGSGLTVEDPDGQLVTVMRA
jgi:hypothetical protein